MGLFIVFVSSLILVIVGLLILMKKTIKTDNQIRILFLILPILTIACHYSSLLYHAIVPGTSSPMDFLLGNPNLILPIYPCNVVMWLLLLVGIFWKYREKRAFRVIIDFCFYFGVVGALVGMLVNVDFIREPTLKNYDITKGIIAHGFMLMNILALPVFKIVKLDLHSNFVHLMIGVILMGVLGLYNNLLVRVTGGEGYALQVNSMFLLVSPFADVPWLKFPIIVLFVAPAYFLVFQILDLIFYEKGNRWIHREKTW